MNGELAGPGDRFVSINNDTVYSIAPDTSNWLPAPAAPFRPSCACTSRARPCWTAATGSRRSGKRDASPRSSYPKGG